MDHNEYRAEALCDAKYKDESPVRTVEKIRSVLQTYGIETEERWLESSVPSCYSLRVTVAGTTFGVNGKGVTREFALASGYGELMERLQLGYLGSGDTQKDGVFSVNDSQSEDIPARTLLEKNRGWYALLAEKLHWATGETLSAEEILMQYADDGGNVAATPYYCVTTGTKEYIPAALRKAVYNANGCAAGNTAEEAIVQGISEVVERHHLLRIITEDITPPDIPEEVLKTCEVAYRIITFIREKGFRVILKDCSLGTDFPVICACIIDRQTGRYHTHFGAFPVFEIALERTLTESFQGRNIRNIAQFDNFRYGKSQTLDLKNLSHELNKGTGEKQPALFAGKPSYEFRADIGLPGENNRELLRSCVAYFRRLGYDLLVRDGGCLGFPTYQILVPGYSEVFSHRLSPNHNDRRYVPYAQRVLRNPASAPAEDIMGLFMHMKQTARLDQRTSFVHGFLAGAGLSAKLSPQEDSCLMAASLACVNYTLGRYSETVRYIDKMLSTGAVKNEEYLICVKRYLSFLLNRCDKAEARAILEVFHNPGTVEKLYGCLARGGNPMEEFTLHCDGNCGGDCVLSQVCCKRRVGELGELIRAKTREMDFDAMVRLLDEALKN